MEDFPGKTKPSLQSLLKDQAVISGKDLIKRLESEALKAAHQKAVLNEAIEFEERNRRRAKTKI